MTRREIERILQAHGFWLLKNGTKHYLWTNGTQLCPVSKGSKTSARTVKNMLARIARGG